MRSLQELPAKASGEGLRGRGRSLDLASSNITPTMLSLHSERARGHQHVDRRRKGDCRAPLLFARCLPARDGAFMAEEFGTHVTLELERADDSGTNSLAHNL